LTWSQLSELVAALLAAPQRCLGCSIAIYDPDQDADATDAARIVQFARNVLAASLFENRS